MHSSDNMAKRKKGLKGQPSYDYGEFKERVNLSLTPSAIASYDSIAQKLGKSRSQVIEELGRLDESLILELLTPKTDSQAEAVLRFCAKVEAKAI